MATTTPRIISLPSALEEPLSSSKSILGEADGDGALKTLLLVVVLLVVVLVVVVVLLVVVLVVVVVLLVVAVAVAVVARVIVEGRGVGGSVMSSPQLVTVRKDGWMAQQ